MLYLWGAFIPIMAYSSFKGGAKDINNFAEKIDTISCHHIKLLFGVLSQVRSTMARRACFDAV